MHEHFSDPPEACPTVDLLTPSEERLSALTPPGKVIDPPPLQLEMMVVGSGDLGGGGGRQEQRQDAQAAAQIRYLKIKKYWAKKQSRSFAKKIVSKNRKKIADNKLRIQGKFVTIE